MANRKLGRPTDQRMAMLRNQVTNLIWYGKIETTLARGKEVQSLAEHLVTIAMRQCDNTIEVTKKHMNDKKQVEELTVQNDSPARLAARRQVMRYLYDIPAVQKEGEDKADFKKRDGFRTSLERSAELGLYRQDYCGCEFSRPRNGGVRMRTEQKRGEK